MATHSSLFAQEISWTEEPGGLQSMGSRKSQKQLGDGTTATCPSLIYELLYGEVGRVFKKL